MEKIAHLTPRRRESGFSMIELLVVVGVLGIIVAAGLPAMTRHTGTNKLKQAADEVSGSLKMARQRAVATSGSVVVQFESGYARLYIFDDPNENGVHDDGETMAGPYEMPKGVDLATVGFADERVTFGPRGAASESQSVVVRNGAAIAQTVSVTAATGLIYVSDVHQFTESGPEIPET